MIIRPATPDDASEIAEILNEIIRAGGTTAIQHKISAHDQAAIIRDLPLNACFHVALDPDTHAIIGFQYLEPHPALPANIGAIATFAKIGVVQKGIGTALFTQTRKSAPDLGFNEIDATIRADNSGGLAYYHKMGFRDHSVAQAKPLDDGTRVDRISKRFLL